jgi:type I restriction enzyme S subunit
MKSNPSAWRKTKLKDVCDRITVGYVGPMADEYTPEGITFLRSQNITPFRLNLEDVKFIPATFYTKIKKSALKPGDVAVVRTGYPGTACVIPESLPDSNCADLVVITPSKELNSFYLAAIFNSAWGMASVRGNLVGVAQQHFNVGAAKEMEVTLPPRAEQDRIAGILSAYDELIENSQRRIRLLEDMARALYREWFVHFRFPGHESVPHLPSALGNIPKGWECVTLGSIIKVTHGCAFQGIHFSEEPTSRVLATPGNFRVGGGIKYDKLKFYSEQGPLESAYVFEPMDLMVTMTDLSKAGDTLGFPAFIPKLQSLTFLHNQRIGRVLPVGEFFPKHYLYCLLCEERYRHHIVGGATGTAVKHTSPTRILSFPFASPKDAKLIHAFENFARPIFRQINNRIEALENLRRTRDLLLPRLLNGQITTISNASPS